MNEYEYKPSTNQQPVYQQGYVQPQQEYVQPQQGYVPPQSITPVGDPAVCADVRKVMASNLVFAGAIVTAVQILLMVIAGVIDDILGWMIALAIPFMLYAVEFWITFGTARWCKTGIKTGGLVVGKVFSIINVVTTGFTIVFDLIALIAGAVFYQMIADYLDDFLNEYLDLKAIFGDLTTLGSTVIFVLFFVSVIPLIMNILLQIQLNVFRNKIIDATEGKLKKTPKTLFLVVLLFLVGLPLLALAGLLLWVGIHTDISTAMIGIAYVLSAAMYFYVGVIAIRCGKGR